MDGGCSPCVCCVLRAALPSLLRSLRSPRARILEHSTTPPPPHRQPPHSVPSIPQHTDSYLASGLPLLQTNLLTLMSDRVEPPKPPPRSACRPSRLAGYNLAQSSSPSSSLDTMFSTGRVLPQADSQRTLGSTFMEVESEEPVLHRPPITLSSTPSSPVRTSRFREVGSAPFKYRRPLSTEGTGASPERVAFEGREMAAWTSSFFGHSNDPMASSMTVDADLENLEISSETGSLTPSSSTVGGEPLTQLAPGSPNASVAGSFPTSQLPIEASMTQLSQACSPPMLYPTPEGSQAASVPNSQVSAAPATQVSLNAEFTNSVRPKLSSQSQGVPPRPAMSKVAAMKELLQSRAANVSTRAVSPAPAPSGRLSKAAPDRTASQPGNNPVPASTNIDPTAWVDAQDLDFEGHMLENLSKIGTPMDIDGDHKEILSSHVSSTDENDPSSVYATDVDEDDDATVLEDDERERASHHPRKRTRATGTPPRRTKLKELERSTVQSRREAKLAQNTDIMLRILKDNCTRRLQLFSQQRRTIERSVGGATPIGQPGNPHLQYAKGSGLEFVDEMRRAIVAVRNLAGEQLEVLRRMEVGYLCGDNGWDSGVQCGMVDVAAVETGNGEGNTRRSRKSRMAGSTSNGNADAGSQRAGAQGFGREKRIKIEDVRLHERGNRRSGDGAGGGAI
ncbi:hypothetical protein BDZ91DRAFT_811724 [Kalaharituber pfeilii]|nr:hypothetical protein BDZ91DRAFT_811724 [Kalaharituber pfeilii]